MRILIVNNIFPPEFIGGYELGAYDLARKLSQHGHAVAVATSGLVNSIAPDAEEAFEVHRVLECVGLSVEDIRADDRRTRGAFVNLSNLQALDRVIARFEPDRVLLFNLAGLGAFGVVLRVQSLGFTPVLHLMDDVFAGARGDEAAYERFRRMFQLDAAWPLLRVICMSSRLYDEVSATVGVPLPTPLFVPGWVALDDDPAPDAPGNDGLGNDGLGEDGGDGRTRFVFASRIAPHKGIHLVVEAAALLAGRGEEGFRIDLYGAGEVARWMQHVYARRIEHLVAFRGAPAKADMVRLFRRYDALLLPSWEREPFGFVASEAAVQGCIPIMTGGIGAAEWLLDRHDCLKIARDGHHLAAAMASVIQTPPAERRDRRARLRGVARALFDFERWYPAIERVLLDARPRFVPSRRVGEQSFAALFGLTRLWKD